MIESRLPRGVLTAAVAVALLVAGIGVLAAPRPAHADEIEASNVRIETDDPTALTFLARVTAPAGLRSAEIEYRVLNPKEGDVGGGGSATFGPGPENDVSFTLETRSAQRYIPVGSIFRYHWIFEDNDGDVLETEEQEYLFLDGRYPWVSKQDGDLTVYYYGANESLADDVLASMRSSIADTQALLQVELPYPVRTLVWASEEDGSLARRQQSAAFDELVRTGGERVAPDLIFVFAASGDVVRHETAHLITAVAGDGPVSRIPSWLDEGTAVYMQSSPGGYLPAIEFAIASDRTLVLRNMDSPSNNPGEVDIFYGQSYSTVDYLVREYGEQAFADLYRTVREGSRTDDALEAVYGFDQDGLYNEWREANGLDPIEFTPRVQSTQPPQAEATQAPLGIPTSVAGGGTSNDDGSSEATAEATSEGSGDEAAAPAPVSADEDGGSNATTAIVIGLVTVLIALGLGGGAFALSRRS